VSQLALFFVLQLLGSWVCLAFGAKQERGLGMAMGFLVGLATAVFLSLPLLLLGVFTTVTVAVMLLASLAAAVAVAVRRRRATRAVAVRFLVWAIGFAGLCMPFCVWDVSRMTYDSRVFVEYAIALQDMEGLPLDTLTHLHAWGSFQIVAHALAIVTEESHLYALAPAFTVSLLATLAVAVHRGLEHLAVPSPLRWYVVAIVLAVMLALPLVRLHAIYIHANWGAGGYLFLFAVMFWLADLEEEPAHLWFAFLALLAFSFSRVESPMFTAPFLVLALSQTRLARAVLLPCAVFTVVLTTWLLLMAAVIPSDSIYLTPNKSLLMAASIAGIFVAFLLRDTAIGKRLLPHVPPLVGVLCLVVIGFGIVTRFDTFRIAFPIWQHDLWLTSFWGYFLWPVVAVLTVVSLRIAPPPFSRAIRYGIAVFFALVTLLTCLGADYGAGRFGSLTRVTLQIVPLTCFYFAIALAPAWHRWRSGGDAQLGEPSR
jgi:hypothetical protein